MGDRPHLESARLVPNGEHFVARCSGGHKVALVMRSWTIEVRCRCKHAVRIDAGRLNTLDLLFVRMATRLPRS